MISALVTTLVIATAPSADLNGDGVVDVSDLLVLLNQWGPCPQSSCDGDLNLDGVVDVSDLLVLLNGWGPVQAFDALAIRHNDLAPFAEAFWQPGPKNVLFVGDSIATSGHGWRLMHGFLMAMDHPAGYHSVFIGSGPGAGGIMGSQSLGTFSGASSRYNAYVGGDHFVPHGDYYGGVPVMRTVMHKMGHSGTGPIGWFADSGGNVRRSTLTPARFGEASIVDDWITGNPDITMQLAFTYIAAPSTGSYVNSVLLKNGTGDGTAYSTYDLATTELAHGGGLATGFNLLADRVPVTTNAGASGMRVLIAPTADWSAGHRWFGHAGMKINNEANPNGLAVASLSEGSWSVVHHGTNSAPGSGQKSYTDSELDRFVISAFDRDEAETFIFITLDSENRTKESWLAELDALRTRWRGVHARLDRPMPRFIICSAWPTDRVGQHSSAAMAEAYFAFSKLHDDVAMYNWYSVYDGLLLNGNSPEQTAWAQANGFDAVKTNGGVIDFTTENFGVGGDWVHPHSHEQVFLHMKVIRDDIKAIAERAR